MGEDLIQKLVANSPMAAAIAIPLFYFLQWLRTRIIEPMYIRHIAHIDKIDEQSEKQTETLGKLETCMTTMQRVQQEHLVICRSGPEHDQKRIAHG